MHDGHSGWLFCTQVVITIKYGATFFSRVTTALLATNEQLVLEEAKLAKMSNIISATISEAIRHDSRRDELYTWQAVLGLWEEVQMSESTRGSDRGILGLGISSSRFRLFCAQLELRKLAEKLHPRQSRDALRKVLEIQRRLFDLNKCVSDACGMLMVLLGEHDTLLGLPASSAYPLWFQRTRETLLTTETAMSGRGFSPILQASSGICDIFHVNFGLQQSLLQRFCNEVTAVVPKVDDHACVICSDIAWRPIRLDCSHMFCCRCLVKLQKQGVSACPLCRAPVVTQAGGDNLDRSFELFLKLWFPREVQRKQKQNWREIEDEFNEETGLQRDCVIA
ncbi:hypothetical protein P389DRAFT_22741 [Cystobasidium minutum MCA 4210]|uniref:uncharacterized protein n=1 Tax=Cystobasidium minutum MCA 4210 TaxID=1397322 RepID=UPI0034CEE3BD|eukprot:jgi/Rhomi1/22741/CE22740_551